MSLADLAARTLAALGPQRVARAIMGHASVDVGRGPVLVVLDPQDPRAAVALLVGAAHRDVAFAVPTVPAVVLLLVEAQAIELAAFFDVDVPGPMVPPLPEIRTITLATGGALVGSFVLASAPCADHQEERASASDAADRSAPSASRSRA